MLNEKCVCWCFIDYPKQIIYESKIATGCNIFQMSCEAEVCNPQELHIDNLLFVLTAVSETNEGSFAASQRCCFTNYFLTATFAHE